MSKKKYMGEPIRAKNEKLKSRRTEEEKQEDMKLAKELLAECKATEREISDKLTRLVIKNIGAVVYTTYPNKYIRRYGAENIII